MVGALQHHAAQQSLDTRHSTAGCLLALVLLVPLVARSCPPVLLLGGVLLYVALVVPLVVGYFSPTALCRYLRRIATSSRVGAWIQDFVFQIWILFGFLHFFYREMEIIQLSASQLLFCVLAERVFCPSQTMCGLLFLSFYNIVAYIIKALTMRQWSQLRLHDQDAGNILRQTASFMVSRMNKGVASVSVLLTISYQAHHLDPSLAFLLVSATFFVLTQLQNFGVKMLIELCQKFELELLEGLEEWYIPLALRVVTVSASCVVLALLLFVQPFCMFDFLLALVVLYNNIFVALYRLSSTCWLPLCHQRSIISAFSVASPEQLREKGDSCPVCLEQMNRARITPCGHIFHGSCLRKWVQQAYKCPMCMQDLSVS